MLMVLFLPGLQSTFLGPLNYAILPQHLHESELVGGNVQIEMSIFPIGAFVLSLAGLDLYFAIESLQAVEAATWQSLADVDGSRHVLIVAFLIGFSGR